MKIETIHLKSCRQVELIPITEEVKKIISSNGYDSGVLKLFVPHTTAAITINESFDPDVAADLCSFFKKSIPPQISFLHAEGNSPAHILSSLLGVTKDIFIINGEPALGKWQGIFFCEFDGPRQRMVQTYFQSAN